MTSEKHEQVVADLSTVHTSIEKLIVALISAKRKSEQEENYSNPSRKKIGKLRVEIRANESKLADLQRLRCERAQEEFAARYLEIQQELEQVRGAREGMLLQESSVTGQLAAIQEKIEAFDCKPSWELSTLRKNLSRMVVEPLKRELETKLAAAEAGLNQARQQAKDLASQLEAVRNQLSDSGTREVALKTELEKILALGETHYRLLTGSLQEICTALADPCVTVDRWAAEKLLQGWAQGFTETLGSGSYGDEIRTLNFQVESAGIFYWSDTGEISGSVIFKAMAGNQIWPKGGDVPFNLMQETLEDKRAVQARQPVAI